MFPFQVRLIISESKNEMIITLNDEGSKIKFKNLENFIQYLDQMF